MLGTDALPKKRLAEEMALNCRQLCGSGLASKSPKGSTIAALSAGPSIALYDCHSFMKLSTISLSFNAQEVMEFAHFRNVKWLNDSLVCLSLRTPEERRLVVADFRIGSDEDLSDCEELTTTSVAGDDCCVPCAKASGEPIFVVVSERSGARVFGFRAPEEVLFYWPTGCGRMVACCGSNCVAIAKISSFLIASVDSNSFSLALIRQILLGETIFNCTLLSSTKCVFAFFTSSESAVSSAQQNFQICGPDNAPLEVVFEDGDTLPPLNSVKKNQMPRRATDAIAPVVGAIGGKQKLYAMSLNEASVSWLQLPKELPVLEPFSTSAQPILAAVGAANVNETVILLAASFEGAGKQIIVLRLSDDETSLQFHACCALGIYSAVGITSRWSNDQNNYTALMIGVPNLSPTLPQNVSSVPFVDSPVCQPVPSTHVFSVPTFSILFADVHLKTFLSNEIGIDNPFLAVAQSEAPNEDIAAVVDQVVNRRLEVLRREFAEMLRLSEKRIIAEMQRIFQSQ